MAFQDDLQSDHLSSDERSTAMILHLLGLAGLVGTPILGFIVQVVVWMIKKEESEFIDDQGREAINFQISIFLYSLVAVVFSILFFFLLPFLILLIVPLALVLGIAYIALAIIAGIRANEGQWYRYPFIIRLL